MASGCTSHSIHTGAIQTYSASSPSLNIQISVLPDTAATLAQWPEKDPANAPESPLTLGNSGDNTRRIYLHFSLHALPPNATILSAHLILSPIPEPEQPTTILECLHTDPWTPQDLSWHTQPQGSPVARTTPGIASTRWDLTQSIQEGLLQGQSQRYFQLRLLREGEEQVYRYKSLQSQYAHQAPRLDIVYQIPTKP